MGKWVPWITGVCVYAEDFQLLHVLYGPIKTSPFNACKFSEIHRFNIKHILNIFTGCSISAPGQLEALEITLFCLLRVQDHVGRQRTPTAPWAQAVAVAGEQSPAGSTAANPAHWLLWVSLNAQARGRGDSPLPLHDKIHHILSMAKNWSQYFQEHCRKLKHHLRRHVRIACWDHRSRGYGL